MHINPAKVTQIKQWFGQGQVVTWSVRVKGASLD